MAILMKGEPAESVTLGSRHVPAAGMIGEKRMRVQASGNCLYGTVHVWLHCCKLDDIRCWGIFAKTPCCLTAPALWWLSVAVNPIVYCCSGYRRHLCTSISGSRLHALALLNFWGISSAKKDLNTCSPPYMIPTWLHKKNRRTHTAVAPSAL